MKLLTLLLLCGIGMGCTSKPKQQFTMPIYQPTVPADSRTDWEWRIAHLGNTATDRMYQCVTEMYSIGHGRGPMCQQACEDYDALISAELEHPDWNATLGDGKVTSMPSRRVCTLKRKDHSK
jgi:hypothetical protein